MGKMDKKDYKPAYVVRRLIRFVRTESKAQLWRMIFTALFMAVQPFVGIILPK